MSVFLIPVTKYPDGGNLREKGLFWLMVSGDTIYHSREVLWLEPGAAGYTINTQ